MELRIVELAQKFVQLQSLCSSVRTGSVIAAVAGIHFHTSYVPEVGTETWW